VDGVLGPVKPLFEDGVPRWVVKGGFYDRPRHQTGFVLDWTRTRAGNVPLKKHILLDTEPLFRVEFRAGEGTDFF
jgi:hypothetical protein